MIESCPQITNSSENSAQVGTCKCITQIFELGTGSGKPAIRMVAEGKREKKVM